MSNIHKILVCDDSETVQVAMKGIVESIGHQCVVTSSVKDCREQLKLVSYDLLFLDVQLPDDNGISLLKEMKRDSYYIKTIVMTSSASIAQAVEAMKIGAYDYLSKPVMPKHVAAIIASIGGQATELSDYLIQSKSKKMQDIESQVRRVSNQNVSVCLTGETGVGKEIYAQRIHHLSERSNGPFIAINCPAIPKNLFEAELFGYKKGAFTGATTDRIGKMESANGGTLFLDEVADLGLDAQAKLLRVLQEKKVEALGSNKQIELNIRVLCATSYNLKEESEQGRFRSDLFYRLAQMEIKIPSLKERIEDLDRLIQLFTTQFCHENKCSLRKFASSAVEYLKDYSWPGNIRELKNIVYRILILVDDEVILRESIPNNLLLSTDLDSTSMTNTELLDKEAIYSLVDGEKKMIEQALKKNQYNISQTAKELNIGRTTLYRKMKKYGF